MNRRPAKTSKKSRVVPSNAAHLLIVLSLLALTLAAYSNSFSAGFALDNGTLILQDSRIRAVTPENLSLILRHTYWWPYGESGLYRPFTTLTYLFNYAVLGNGAHAAGYHVVNLLLHALNVMLVYVLARRFFSGHWPPAALAGLWAVHPALTESVTNIVGRADLLAGAAILGGFWLYLKSAEVRGSRRLTWLAALFAITAVGVFSKENGVAILGVIAVYEFLWWNPHKRFSELLPAWGAVLLPVLAMLWVRSALLGASSPTVLAFTDNPLVGAGFWQAKLTALAVLGRYIWLTVWPMNLSADYSYAQIPLANGSSWDWAAWLTVAAALAVAVFLCARNRPAAFFLLFAFVNIAPVTNLLFPIGTIMADRLLYLPSLGICACIVMAACSPPVTRRSPVAAVLVLGLLAGVWGIRTYLRNADWRDNLSLASAEVESSPRSYKAHLFLANSLYETDSGRTNIDRIIAEAEKSVTIVDPLPDARKPPEPYRSTARYYLLKGNSLLDAGKAVTPESRAAYQRSVQLLQECLSIIAALRKTGVNLTAGNEANVRGMLSDAYLHLSETPQALAAALEARRLDPLDPEFHWQLFNVLISQDRASDAATALMAGSIVTVDASMRQELVRLYKLGLDEKGCAVDPGTGALNPACEVVHNQLCDAVRSVGDLSRESPRSAELVERLAGASLPACDVKGH